MTTRKILCTVTTPVASCQRAALDFCRLGLQR